jgi:molybdopterin synthase sulfur carrier subunit
MNVLYFAWVKSKIGVAQETVTPPASVTTVGALLDWLAGQSPAHADALANRTVIRVAVNQQFAQLIDPVSPTDEIGVFPPVTGG